MAQLQTPAGSHSRQEPATGGFAVEAPGGAVIKSRRAGEPESRAVSEIAGARHAPVEPHTVSAAA